MSLTQLLAVVPSLLGPLQSLLLLLPLLAVGTLVALRSLSSPVAWRGGWSRTWRGIRDHPLRSAAIMALLAAAPLAGRWLLQPLEDRPAEAASVQADGSWPTFHGGMDRTGRADRVPAGDTSRLAWKFREAALLERGPFAASPAVASQRVLIGGDNFKLYCLGLDDGAPRWSFEANAPIFSSPAVRDGRVYFGEGLHFDRDCRLLCLDLATGTLLWSFKTGSHTESSPTVSGGKVYFGAGDDGVYCCDARTGKRVWHASVGHVDSAPLVVGGRVFVGSGYQWQGVLCLDASDGRVVWRHPLPAPSWGAPSFRDGRLFVAVGNGSFDKSAAEPVGEVRCLDGTTGEALWRFTDIEDSVLTSVAVAEGRLVFGSRDGACYALDARTGKLLWRTPLGAPVLSSPAVSATRVFVGADDGVFKTLDLMDGRVVASFDTNLDLAGFGALESPIQSSPALAGGRVLFGASNGHVYCLGTPGSTGPLVAGTRFRSRLMRAARWALVGAIDAMAAITSSYGIALLLAALLLKLLLLPLDLGQSRQAEAMRSLQPRLDRMRKEYVDYRVHAYEVRVLLAEAGIRPLAALGSVALQLPLLIVVFGVLLATPVFAGRSFLGIADLSRPDGLVAGVNLLPLALAAFISAFFRATRPPGRRTGILGRLVTGFVSIGIGALAYRWPAALLLFTLALVWLGVFSQRLLRAALGRRPDSTSHA